MGHSCSVKLCPSCGARPQQRARPRALSVMRTAHGSICCAMPELNAAAGARNNRGPATAVAQATWRYKLAVANVTWIVMTTATLCCIALRCDANGGLKKVMLTRHCTNLCDSLQIMESGRWSMLRTGTWRWALSHLPLRHASEVDRCDFAFHSSWFHIVTA